MILPWRFISPPPPPPSLQDHISIWLEHAHASTVALTVLLAAGVGSLARAWWSHRSMRLYLEASIERLRLAREALASRSHFELDELRQFVGRDGGPIVLAMCGRVYDVTDGREYYGENGPYHALTGHDASRLLAKGMLEPESAEQQAVPLRRFELEQLRDWKTHYEQKYVFIGQLVGGHDPLAAMDCAPAPTTTDDAEWRSIEADADRGHDRLQPVAR